MLYFVPTPIGNLKDITLRALELFETRSVFFCEDTRNFKKLLNVYKISLKWKEISPFHAYSSLNIAAKIAHRGLKEDVVIVSEAWTPGLSDPGKEIIKWAYEYKTPFEILPGTNALIPAVVAACFDTSKFVFKGFLPSKKGLTKKINEIVTSPIPVFVYESVHRVSSTLRRIKEAWFNRKVFLARELTKKFEQKECGQIDTILDKIDNGGIPQKWEFVLGFEWM